jgi:predicted enzyme related to lactoylglutathione lyase
MLPRSNVCPPGIALATVCGALLMSPAWNLHAQELSGDLTSAPLFTSTPTILLRTPDPAKLAKFYEALGMKIARVSERGSVVIYLEGNAGSLEIVAMDPNTRPGGPKTSRTQQGVVAIFETTDQAEVVRRAKAAGSPLIERWNSSSRGHSIYYIADPENNIFGFAPRYHNPGIKVP